MNSFMTITVNVRHAQAIRATKEMGAAFGSLSTAMAKAQRGMNLGAFAGQFEALSRAGNQLQWTGRQIEYRFTLPIILAGAAATKFALDNERAFTRLTKVYGTFATDTQAVTRDMAAMRKGFEALSSIFGVAQEEVINIGASWVQAGANAIAAMRATRLTLDTMILGEMEAERATEALISVMAQYGLATDDGKTGTMDLKEAMAVLNMVENETTIGFAELIEVFERSAGSAVTAGIDIQHLAAMAASLVPATGSAERAGNGLRTMISRLMSPTKDAAEVMGLMGLNIEGAWRNMTAAERLEEMAVAFDKLDDGQRAVVSSTVASRYQINRFDILMRDILNPLGRYHTALRTTADAEKNMAQYTKELGIYLSSQPQAFKILWTQLQNAMARIIVPLIPAILGVTAEIVKLVEAFTNLSPATQKFVLAGLLALAVLGPLMAYMGTMMTMVGRLGHGFVWLFAGINGGESALRKLYNGMKFLGALMLDLPKGPGLALSWLYDKHREVVQGMATQWTRFNKWRVDLWTRAHILAAVVAGRFGRAVAAVWGVMAGVWSFITGIVAALWGWILRLTQRSVQGAAAMITANGAAAASAIGMGTAYAAAGSVIYATYNRIPLVAIGAAQLAIAAMQTMGAITTTIYLAIAQTASTTLSSTTAMWVASTEGVIGLQAVMVNWVLSGYQAIALGAATTTRFIVTAFAVSTAGVINVVGVSTSTALAIYQGALMDVHLGVVTFVRAASLSMLALTEVASTAAQAFAGVWVVTIDGVVAYTMSAIQWSTSTALAVITRSTALVVTQTQAAAVAVTTAVLSALQVIAIGATTTGRLWMVTAGGIVSAVTWSTSTAVAVVEAGALVMVGSQELVALAAAQAAATVTAVWIASAETIFGVYALSTSTQLALAGETTAAWVASTNVISASMGQIPIAAGAAMAQTATVMQAGALVAAGSVPATIGASTAATAGIFTRFGRWLTGLWASLIAGIKTIWAAGWTGIFAWLKTTFTAIWKSFVTMVRTVGAAIGKNIMGVFRSIGAAIARSMGGVVGVIVRAIAAIGSAVASVVATIASLPAWVIVTVIAAVIALVSVVVYKWGDGLGQFFEGLVNRIQTAWAKLPEGIYKAMKAVVDVISAGVRAAWEWMSYLNPFARHSPSLVESVIAGVDIIASRYASLSGIGAVFRRAVGDLRAFASATAEAQRSIQAAERSEQRNLVVAVSPGAGPSFDSMVSSLGALERALEGVAREFVVQEAVVAQWTTRLREAERALDAARLAMDDATEELDRLAAIQPTGLRAMEDQIFANEQAQKRLRLELLRMEDAGQSIDDIESKMLSLAGEIEMLRGDAGNLRLLGAGSEVLGPIEAQIRAMEAARAGLATQGSPMGQVQTELERLQREGEILDLEKALNFDGVLRGIDQMLNPITEMGGSELMAAIAAQQAEVTRLTAAYDQAEATHEAVRTAYEAEKALLDELGAAYDAIEAQIRDMDSALSSLAQSAQTALSAAGGAGGDLSNVAEQFGIGGDFDVPMGNAVLGAELGDPMALADQWAKEAEKLFADMDMFAPIREKWEQFTSWITTTGEKVGAAIWGALVTAWQWVVAAWDSSVGPWVEGLFGVLSDAVGRAAEGLGSIFEGGFFRTIGDWIGRLLGIFRAIGDALSLYVLPVLGMVFSAFATVFGGIAQALSWFWDNVAQPIFHAIGWFLIEIVGAAFSLLLVIVTEAWEFIGGLIMMVWNTILKPVFEMIWAIITTAVMPVFQMLQAVVAIALAAIAGAIWLAWKIFIEPVFNMIKWIIEEVVAPVISWLWEHVVGPVFGAIANFIKDQWENWVEPVFYAIKDVLENVVGAAFDAVLVVVTFVMDTIVDAVRTSVNFIIDAFNILATGINWITEKLNIGITIDEIPNIGEVAASPVRSRGGGGMMAMGGVVPASEVGDGFITNRARAIVGEGSRLWPEYVIPTDPRYRGRAGSLFASLGQDLGFYQLGGILDWGRATAGNAVSRGADAIGGIASGIREGAATLIFGPALAGARALLNLVPIDIVREVGVKVTDAVLDWVKGKDAEVGPGIGAQAIGGSGWQALVRYLQSTGVPHRVTSTYRPGGRSYHGQGRAADFSLGGHGQRGYGAPGLRNIFEAFLPVAANLTELILAGAPFNIKNGHRVPGYAWGSPGSRGNHWNHVHAALAAGGIIPFSVFDTGGWLRPGLTLAYNGTGRSEMVTSGGEGPGARELHFHGDLSFPNVRSGDDAEAFVRNLETLVKT